MKRRMFWLLGYAGTLLHPNTTQLHWQHSPPDWNRIFTVPNPFGWDWPNALGETVPNFLLIEAKCFRGNFYSTETLL